jgi:transposase
MSDYHLADEQLLELCATHRRPRDKREADRIKVAVLLATGQTAEQVAEVLQIDPNTVRSHFKRYRQDGVKSLGQVAFRGSACQLDPAHIACLEAHLQRHLYLSAKAIARWLEDPFAVTYIVSGMTVLLHRAGDVYKKPKLIPGKADPEAQKAFLAEYEKLKDTKGEADPIYSMDAVHPQHNPVIAQGWIKRGEDREIRSNAGRRRVNINGAIDLKRLEPVVLFDDRVNADSTITLLTRLEQHHPHTTAILVICDNARDYRSKAVRAYLETLRIQLLFLPLYAPNLNLIERLWRFFKKRVLYNRYFERFTDVKDACEDFFRHPSRYRGDLQYLLTENFAIVGERNAEKWH